MSANVLSVRDLRVSIGPREIVHGIDFDVADGQTLGIVGESGSGKTMSVLAATGLIDAPGARVSGSSILLPASGSDAGDTEAHPWGRPFLEKHIERPLERVYYLCAPRGLMALVGKHLAAMGVPADRVHRERW